MGFSLNIRSLSALSPVKIAYAFNKEEKLSGTLTYFFNGIGYYKHNAFEDFQDATLSKGNCLVLTKNKPLKEIFESDSKTIDVGTIAGSLLLKTSDGKYVSSIGNDLYAGGAGAPLLITVIPIQGNTVELKINKSTYIQIDDTYPYTARLSQETLNEFQLDRQQFLIEYGNGKLSFKTKTAEGYRYLSYGTDRVLRAVGLMLNERIVNSYFFDADFISEKELYYDFDAKTSEVKYFNELTSYENRYNLNIKEEHDADTHLLLSCTTESISLSNKVPINIALMKTNFSTSGSYSTTQIP